MRGDNPLVDPGLTDTNVNKTYIFLWTTAKLIFSLINPCLSCRKSDFHKSAFVFHFFSFAIKRNSGWSYFFPSQMEETFCLPQLLSIYNSPFSSECTSIRRGTVGLVDGGGHLYLNFHPQQLPLWPKMVRVDNSTTTTI